MWRILFKPFGFRVIVTVDHDKDIRIRFATFTEHGVIARGVADKRFLPVDGTGIGYISKWFEI